MAVVAADLAADLAADSEAAAAVVEEASAVDSLPAAVVAADSAAFAAGAAGVVAVAAVLSSAASFAEETSESSETAGCPNSVDCRPTAGLPTFQIRAVETRRPAVDSVETGTADYPCLPGKD